MRKVVFQMMTALNGTLNDPDAWMTDMSEDMYQEVDRAYGEFDTILVGRTTYDEMKAFWPDGDKMPGATESHKNMARKMSAYRKLVFSSGEQEDLGWNNAELVSIQNDDDIAAYIKELKQQDGKDIHLSGGARFAQTVIRLGLVDEFHFFVHPNTAPGAPWFGQISEERRSFELIKSQSFENGVVALYYAAKK